MASLADARGVGSIAKETISEPNLVSTPKDAVLEYKSNSAKMAP